MSTDPNSEDYYALLGVPPQATRKQISDSYKKIALRCHPDRIDDPQEKSEAVHFFAKCTQAYDALTDPVTRALYDMVTGVTTDSLEERKRINNIKKEDAKRASSLMEEAVQENMREEELRNGCIILDGRYGRLEVDPNRPLQPPLSVRGQYIDVTIPLQCMVDQSHIIIPGGGSKSWHEGFYDPSEDCDPSQNILYVKYRFLGNVHQVVVGDTEELRLPMTNHLITPEDEAYEKEMQLQDLRDIESKKARRRWLLASLVICVGGALAYRNRESRVIQPILSRLASLISGSPVPSSSSSNNSRGGNSRSAAAN